MLILERLSGRPEIASDPLCQRLLPILTQPTGVSSSGYPYLQRDAWEMFRDRVPHLFGAGLAVLRALDRITSLASQEAGDETADLLNAAKVVRQVVLSAAITAPTDLWLMRQVLGTFAELGLLERLVAGEALYPECCEVHLHGEARQLRPAELEKDLHFLLARGIVEQYDNSFRIAGHPRVLRLVEEIDPVPNGEDTTRRWRRVFCGKNLTSAEQGLLLDLAFRLPEVLTEPGHNHWVASLEEVEIGYWLVPIVLGLRAAERTSDLSHGTEIRARHWSQDNARCAAGALEVLTAAGWMVREGERYRVTRLGARGFERAPGPFGIIQAYHPYMEHGKAILLSGRGDIWVRRGENIGPSQDANRSTFAKANASLDRFCADTDFRLGVFIEHAIGRGEATRQRFERGPAGLRYFGADLEDAAIDAAIQQQAAGCLPPDMVFVRAADIGEPRVLLDALRQHGADSCGAVMLVGNGFHEVRNPTDRAMVEVFRGYQQAGIILLFTEENALSIDDLRATAWNTYHAGFKYVHEKSGQALRPAEPRSTTRLGHPLRAAWSECAERAGYVRLPAYCTRTRTVYPYPRPGRANPAISVNHFFVPGAVASELGFDPGSGR